MNTKQNKPARYTCTLIKCGNPRSSEEVTFMLQFPSKYGAKRRAMQLALASNAKGFTNLRIAD